MDAPRRDGVYWARSGDHGSWQPLVVLIDRFGTAWWSRLFYLSFDHDYAVSELGRFLERGPDDHAVAAIWNKVMESDFAWGPECTPPGWNSNEDEISEEEIPIDASFADCELVRGRNRMCVRPHDTRPRSIVVYDIEPGAYILSVADSLDLRVASLHRVEGSIVGVVTTNAIEHLDPSNSEAAR